MPVDQFVAAFDDVSSSCGHEDEQHTSATTRKCSIRFAED